MFFSRKARAKVLLIPPSPTSPGSCGDEAIILGALDQAQAGGKLQIEFAVERTGNPLWRFARDEKIPLVELGQMSARKLKRYAGAIFFGADTSDGTYNVSVAIRRLNYLQRAIEAGIPARLTNFSYSPHVDSRIVDALKNLHQSGASFSPRDPLSGARFTAGTGIKAGVVPDIAFVLKGHPAPPEIGMWIGQQRNAGRRIVAINPNGFETTTISGLIESCSNLSFILIVHDRRMRYDEESLIRQILNDSNDNTGRLYSFTPRSTRTVHGVLSLVDAVITGRMHLAIASLCVGKPCLALNISSKFEGLFRLFEMEELLIEPGCSADGLRTRLGELMERDEIQQRICARLPEVQRLAMNHLQLP